MNPTNPQSRQQGAPTPPARPQAFTPPSRPVLRTQQTAAAEVIRGQINSIYDGNSGEQTPHTTPTPVDMVPTQQPQPTQPVQSQLSRFSTTPTQSQRATDQRHNLRTVPPETTPKISGSSITARGKNTTRCIMSATIPIISQPSSRRCRHSYRQTPK